MSLFYNGLNERMEDGRLLHSPALLTKTQSRNSAQRWIEVRGRPI